LGLKKSDTPLGRNDDGMASFKLKGKTPSVTSFTNASPTRVSDSPLIRKLVLGDMGVLAEKFAEPNVTEDEWRVPVVSSVNTEPEKKNKFRFQLVKGLVAV
jgi:hypothetical protein